MSLNAFAVVSEFKFDVANALVGSAKLQEKVDAISHSANQARNSIEGLGIGFLASFSGANAGILGILGNAIKASDKFRQSQIELASAMTANKMTIGGGVMSFKQSLEASDNIMGEIVKKALSLRISPSSLVEQTKFYTNALAPKKLAGDNLSQAVELARVSLKAAPALGVSNQQTTDGILAGLSAQLSNNTQFGRRLFLESGKKIEEKTGIKNVKEFNKAIPALRIKAMIVGLDKLAGTSEVVKARANTLGAALSNIANLFQGLGSILKPIGDVIMKPLLKVLNMLTDKLTKHGLTLTNSIARLIEPIIESPKKLLLGFITLQGLAEDAAKAGGLTMLTLGLIHLGSGLKFLASIPIVRNIVAPILTFAKFIGKDLFKKAFKFLTSSAFLTSLRYLWTAFKWVATGLGHIAAGFIAFMLPLIALRRALSRVKIDSLEWLANNTELITQQFLSLKNSLMRFVAPLIDITKGWEELFYFLLSGKHGLTLFKSELIALSTELDNISMGFLKIYAGIRGFVAGITFIMAEFLTSIPKYMMAITSGDSSVFKDTGKEFMQYMTEEFDKTIKEYTDPLIKDGKNSEKVQDNKHVYNVSMNNNFKEVLQPDRIAFTIQDQLQKASDNKKSSRSSSFSSNARRAVN